jgi:hypothetical protein
VDSDGNLPGHFLTKFLEEQNITLTGAEDIKVLRTTKDYQGPPSDRLRRLVKELENGTAFFDFKPDAEEILD